MTPKEQETAIKELEERVDRLRNIYEQYFLGFERLEPTVPRKDVDRRLALMRKEQIRNTAIRFKLNVIVQKYNTYSTHWIRICRQIEEGTYKRHVRRAKARFGDLTTAPELSIDVDMGDFEMDAELGVNGALAEANAAAESRESLPPPSYGTMPSGRAFADRAARPAALPPGSHPRVVVRKRDDTVEQTLASPVAGELEAVLREARAKAPVETLPDGAPSSARGAPAASSTLIAAGARPRIVRTAVPESARTAGAQAASRIPVALQAGAGSSGRLPASAPASAPLTERQPMAPGSTPTMGRPPIVVTPPSGWQPGLPPSTGRHPAAPGSAPQPPSTGRAPVAQTPSSGRPLVAQGPSSGRSPLGDSSAGKLPLVGPAYPPPESSSGRSAAAGAANSAGRMPPATGSAPSPSVGRVPAASVGRVPAAAGSSPSVSRPGAPAPREPASEPGGMPSTPRQPVATSAGPRVAVGPPGAAGAPQIRPVGSGARVPIGAPASGSGPAAPPRPHGIPAVPGDKPFVERETDPGAPPPLPPGSRPRLPLPNAGRTTKKE